MSGQVTVATRPSLAFPDRWSIDWWRTDREAAAYQASLVTFDSLNDAERALPAVQLAFEKQGIAVVRAHSDSNRSRDTTPPPQESEAELSKHLETYVKSAFARLQKFTLAKLFDFNNWPKGIKTILSKSPHLLSLVFLAALFFRGPFERLVKSILPKELEQSGDILFAIAPLLILATSLHVYLERARYSSELNRVREWILHLVISYKWDRKRFEALMNKELGTREYAAISDSFNDSVKRNPSSLTNLTVALGKRMEKPNEEQVSSLLDRLMQGDFARKIQALSGMASEPDYRPKHLAIAPYFLLLSLNSIKATMLGLKADGPNSPPGFNIQGVNSFNEGMTIIGFVIGILLSLVVIGPTLVWTTIIAWEVSPILFAFDVAASVWTIWLLTSRGLAVAFRRKYVPKGLGLHECTGALNVM